MKSLFSPLVFGLFNRERQGEEKRRQGGKGDRNRGREGKGDERRREREEGREGEREREREGGGEVGEALGGSVQSKCKS